MALCVFLHLLFVVVHGWHEPLLQGVKMGPDERQAVTKEVQSSARKTFLARSKRIGSDESSPGCAMCVEKDYQNPCPSGWMEAKGGMCRAPAGYAGVCNTRQSFTGADKREAEMLCGLCWPCKEEASGCVRNWDAPCPHGYSPVDIPYYEYANATGTTCARDIEYEGLCEQEVTLEDVDAKREFAERCEVSWPCKTHCEHSLASQCPEDWSAIGDSLCVAPNNFKVSGCQLLQYFGGWSASMKAAFATKCKVVWPCEADTPQTIQDEGPVVHADCTDLDLTADSCPRFWYRREDGFCEPPPTLGGACAASKDFRGMSSEQKILWSSECFVDWKCVGEHVADGDAVARGAAQVNTFEAGPITYGGRIVASSAN